MTTPRYLDIHLLQTVPYANLNRDDLGSPKTVVYGGAERTRVSSQCWKRATRLEVEAALGDRAVRTRRVAVQVAERLRHAGFDKELAAAGGRQVLASAGKGLKVELKDNTSSVLLYVPASTLDELAALVVEHRDAVAAEAAKKKPAAVLPAARVAELLSARNPTISLFGRMLAELPGAGVDGAVQVAHAFTTHATQVEVDFFTAVDDLNPADEHGSGHMNSGEFAAGVFYRYACVDIAGLADNLTGDTATLTGDTATLTEVTTEFLRAFIGSLPTGKRTATAPNTLPELAYVAVRADRPISLAGAFEAPVRADQAGGYAAPSRRQLADYAHRLHILWGGDGVIVHGHAGIDAKSLEGLGVRHASYPQLINAAVTAATAVTAAAAGVAP
jgi:CRISPR system Cascade subunit CasC